MQCHYEPFNANHELYVFNGPAISFLFPQTLLLGHDATILAI